MLVTSIFSFPIFFVPVCGTNARGKIAIGKIVRGKIAIGKNVRANVVKVP